MKEILCCLILVCTILVSGCSDNRKFVEYPHEYMGIVETRVRTSGVVIGRYVHGNGKVIYQADCSPSDSNAFENIIFDQNDGDEDFALFLSQNVGRKVKINVNVIAREGYDHEASYGTFEIVNYEVIE